VSPQNAGGLRFGLLSVRQGAFPREVYKFLLSTSMRRISDRCDELGGLFTESLLCTPSSPITETS